MDPNHQIFTCSQATLEEIKKKKKTHWLLLQVAKSTTNLISSQITVIFCPVCNIYLEFHFIRGRQTNSFDEHYCMPSPKHKSDYKASNYLANNKHATALSC